MDKKPQAIKKQDYFSQKRKNQQYKAPEGEVLELLSAVTQDTRFMDAYNKRIEEGRAVNMDTWIGEAEDRDVRKVVQKVARMPYCKASIT